MADKLKSSYDLAGGDLVMALTSQANSEQSASLQLVLGDTFDGTTATARFKQSNSLDLLDVNWNYLPEDAMVLISGSNLLQTNSFTCRYIAVEIIVGDATTGVSTFHQNFQ